MTLIGTNWLTAIGRLLRRDRVQTSWAWQDRQSAYMLWDAYYANTIYEALSMGGQRETINNDLGNASAADLAGLYNPVANVVDLFLHVFDGRFGDEILVEPDGQGAAGVVDAIEQIWTWSNLSIEKQTLCRFCANHGTVGVRVVARNDPMPEKRRVYLKVEHPRIIRDVELDARGNVAAIQLEYDLTTGLAEDAQTILIREELDQEVLATYRITTSGQVTQKIPYNVYTKQDDQSAVAANPLGVVPYVLMRHEHYGETFGRNAYYKARAPIDRLNSLVSHIDIQIHQHVNGVLFVAAHGAPPVEMDLSGRSVAYVDTRGSTTPPTVEWLVAHLDLASSTAQARMQIDLIEDQLPELKATAGKFLAGQSGETIAELRKPAIDKLVTARANYEDALIRAQKIGLSWGILLDLWDLGTSTGSREAAEAAYNQGLEDHRFNARAYLESQQPEPPPQQQPPPMVEGQPGQPPPPPPPAEGQQPPPPEGQQAPPAAGGQ
jgi:hypothetical protein